MRRLLVALLLWIALPQCWCGAQGPPHAPAPVPGTPSGPGSPKPASDPIDPSDGHDGGH